MNSTLRWVIVFAISAAILMIHEWLYPTVRTPPKDPSEISADAEAPTSPTEAVEAGTPSDPSEPGEPASGPASAPSDPGLEVRDHRLSDEALQVDVSTGGVGLIRHVEPRRRQFVEPDGRGLDFLHLEGSRSLELSIEGEPGWVRQNGAMVEMGDQVVEIRHRSGEIEVTETLGLLGDYSLQYSVDVRNLGATPREHRLRVGVRLGEAEASQYDVHRGFCRTDEELDSFDADDVEDGEGKVGRRVRWFGVDSKYFLQAVVPVAGAFDGCEIRRGELPGELVAIGETELVRLEAGGTHHHEFRLFLGAKEQAILGRFGIDGVDLQEVIDWGFLGSVSRVLGSWLLDLLRAIQSVTGIWGVSIIILTILVKGATLPLTLKQFRSMRRMREIQPEMEALRAKYADDRQKQSAELQALFQRTGVNPFAGCLPVIAQMPVWFALYSMLGAVVELYHEPFLWLGDLTKQDPYYILPLTIGGLMFLQMRMQPATDSQQAKMMQWLMPTMFVGFMLFLPAGLGVYIFANSVLSLLQTFIQLRPDLPPNPSPKATS